MLIYWDFFAYDKVYFIPFETQLTLKLLRVKNTVTNVIDIICIIDTQIFLTNYLLFAELKKY